MEKNFSGTCLISFVVNASGSPEQLKVVRSLGPDFDQSALDAVKQYRFEPAMFNGQPVAVSVKVEVNFKRF
jgi:protein TonB